MEERMWDAPFFKFIFIYIYIGTEEHRTRAKRVLGAHIRLSLYAKECLSQCLKKRIALQHPRTVVEILFHPEKQADFLIREYAAYSNSPVAVRTTDNDFLLSEHGPDFMVVMDKRKFICPVRQRALLFNNGNRALPGIDLLPWQFSWLVSVTGCDDTFKHPKLVSTNCVCVCE
jgi:hypothetical protein